MNMNENGPLSSNISPHTLSYTRVFGYAWLLEVSFVVCGVFSSGVSLGIKTHPPKIDIIYRLVIMDSCYTYVNNYFKGDIQLFSSIECYFPLMNILYKVDLIYQTCRKLFY